MHATDEILPDNVTQHIAQFFVIPDSEGDENGMGHLNCPCGAVPAEHAKFGILLIGYRPPDGCLPPAGASALVLNGDGSGSHRAIKFPCDDGFSTGRTDGIEILRSG